MVCSPSHNQVIAAKRAGVHHVILPVDNQRDFEELPEFIKQGVMVHYASTYSDVFKVAFADDLPVIPEPTLTVESAAQQEKKEHNSQNDTSSSSSSDSY